MGEPKYVTELKDQFQAMRLDVVQQVTRINTKIEALPKIEQHLNDINESVAANKEGISLVKQRQDDCPARALHKANPNKGALGFAKWGLREFGMFGVVAFIAILALVALLAQTGVFEMLFEMFK